ncbi:MAG: hypothetical protein O3A00_00795 [Planctomycetota bacterium]|nr:hypothetical protein [Planctomycetota bacterium]
MAKAKPSARNEAIQWLTKAMLDPKPLPLRGTNAKPGIFTGGSKVLIEAAALAAANGWVEPTGEVRKQGKKTNDLYRISQAGIEFALQNCGELTLLRELLDVSDSHREFLRAMPGQLEEVFRAIRGQLDEVLGAMRGQLENTGKSLIVQNDLVGRLLKRESLLATATAQAAIAAQAAVGPQVAASSTATSAAPNAAAPSMQADAQHGDMKWLTAAVEFVRDYRRRNPQQTCPLPDLFRHVGQSNLISIGQFHDGLRQLVREQRLALHPYTGPMYQLKDEQYALLLGQEIKFYADIKQ